MGDDRKPLSSSHQESYSSDTELVAQLLAGSNEAWRFLIVRYTRLMRTRVECVAATCGMRSDPHAVEDLVAEVFSALLRNDSASLRAYQGRSSLATYLSVIAARVTMRAGIEKKGTPNMESTLDIEETRLSDPQRIASHEELVKKISGLVSTLPEKQREIILLHYNEGCSYQEISDRLKVPIGSIGPTLKRAEERLKLQLETNPLSR